MTGMLILEPLDELVVTLALVSNPAAREILHRRIAVLELTKRKEG